MNKAQIQQVLDALSINRVMAKDANGNYTREVTPKAIMDAINLCKDELARVVEPVAWRDPTNSNPCQGCTYDKEKHVKWPHIYSQALFTTPQAAAQQDLPRGECFTNGVICAKCGHPDKVEAAAQPSQVRELSDEEILAALRSITNEPPVRLPPGWKNFARAIITAINAKGAA